MSMCEKEKIQCPVCGTTGEFEMWTSLNTELNPEKKEQLLSGALFQYICPHCGKSFNIDYPMLYHQMEDQIMIYYVVQEQFRGEFGDEENELTKVLKEDMDSYLYRIVGSQRELMEKIRIFDAGKDDRVVELVKRIISDAVADKNPDVKDATLYYLEEEGESLFVAVNSKGALGTVPIPKGMYEDMAEGVRDKLPDLRSRSEFRINRDWASKALGME